MARTTYHRYKDLQNQRASVAVGISSGGQCQKRCESTVEASDTSEAADQAMAGQPIGRHL